MSVPTDDSVRPKAAAFGGGRWVIVIGVLVALVGAGAYVVWDNYVNRRQAIDACTAVVEARVEASGAGAYTITAIRAGDYDTYSIEGLVDIADGSANGRCATSSVPSWTAVSMPSPYGSADGRRKDFTCRQSRYRWCRATRWRCRPICWS